MVTEKDDKRLNFVLWILGAILSFGAPWATFITIEIVDLAYVGRDRFTASMAIEAHQTLGEKNPTLKTLTAREIREIQRNQTNPTPLR